MSYALPTTHPAFLDGVAINTQGWGPSTNGVVIRRITGWFDAPDIRDTREPKSDRDGEHADELHKGGRTITLEGIVDGSSVADLAANMAALADRLAPTASELVFKIPEPDNAAPSWVYAASMVGFERVEARVVDGVRFGAQVSPVAVEWVCSLRASDPLIYSDVEIVDTDGVIASYGGTAATPVVMEVEWNIAGSNGLHVTDADGTTFLAPVVASGASLVDGTTYPKVRIDAAERSAALALPHAAGRLALFAPVALWKFNEAAGVTADNAQGTAALDGTYVGGPTLNQAGPFTDSKSVTLETTGDSISVPYNAALYPDEWTLEGWYKTAKVGPSFVYLLDWSGPGSQGFAVQVNTSTARVLIGDGVATLQMALVHNFAVASSDWHHIAIVYRNGQMRLLIDGVLSSFSAVNYTKPTSGIAEFGSTLIAATATVGLSTWTLHGVALSDAQIGELSETVARFTTEYKAGNYIKSVPSWPMIAGAKSFVVWGDYGAMTFTYREARL